MTYLSPCTKEAERNMKKVDDFYGEPNYEEEIKLRRIENILFNEYLNRKRKGDYKPLTFWKAVKGMVRELINSIKGI